MKKIIFLLAMAFCVARCKEPEHNLRETREDFSPRMGTLNVDSIVDDVVFVSSSLTHNFCIMGEDSAGFAKLVPMEDCPNEYRNSMDSTQWESYVDSLIWERRPK